MESLYLPVVNPECAGPLDKEIRENEKCYLKKQFKRLDEENPIISKWIKTYAKTTGDKKGAAYCALMVYRLLEKQAEADLMNAGLI